MSKRLLDKLEKYEQEAYAGGFGQDWLEDLGMGFKLYISTCLENGIPATMKGWEKFIDIMAKNL